MNKTSKKTRLIIVGGSGFVGTNLINYARIENKFEIISVSRKTKVKGIKNIHTDLTSTDFSFLKKLKPDYVIYLGTVSSPRAAAEDSEGAFNTNVVAVRRFLEKVKELKIKKIIFISSYVLYKNTGKSKYVEGDTLDSNKDVYNLCKFIQEQIIQFYRDKFSLPITIFRMSNSYGPYQELANASLLIESLFKKAIVDKSITVADISPIRDWVFIEDVAKSLVLELNKKEFGTYNLGTGKGENVGKVVREISKLTGIKYINSPDSTSIVSKCICDTKKLKKHLGYVPNTNVSKGLLKTYKYYQKLYSTETAKR